MPVHPEKEFPSTRYIIAETKVAPNGLVCLILAASYDAFARCHGVGECTVQIYLSDGTEIDSAGSIAIINTSDPVSARPLIMVYDLPHVSRLPEGSYCHIVQTRAKR